MTIRKIMNRWIGLIAIGFGYLCGADAAELLLADWDAVTPGVAVKTGSSSGMQHVGFDGWDRGELRYWGSGTQGDVNSSSGLDGSAALSLGESGVRNLAWPVDLSALGPSNQTLVLSFELTGSGTKAAVYLFHSSSLSSLDTAPGFELKNDPAVTNAEEAVALTALNGSATNALIVAFEGSVYDSALLVFQQSTDESTAPHLDNVRLGTDATGLTVHAAIADVDWYGFVKKYNLSGTRTDDADGDGQDDYTEYVTGGDPTHSADIGFLPSVDLRTGEYTYRVRRDSRLIGHVLSTDDLSAPVWTTNDSWNVSQDYGGMITNRVAMDLEGERLFIKLEVETDSGPSTEPADYFVDLIQDDNPTIISPAGDVTEQTATLNAAIIAASNQPNGGLIRLSAGTYTLNEIEVYSNVRIEIDPAALIIMNEKVLFNVGKYFDARKGTAPAITNVQITSTVDGTERAQRYTIDVNVTGDENKIPFRLGYVENFEISRFHVLDEGTVFPCIFMVVNGNGNPAYSTNAVGEVIWNETYDMCSNGGVIRDCSAEDVSPSYALVQPFAAKNIYFKNLSCTGGMALRLEPGDGSPDDGINQSGPDYGALSNIYAEDLSTTNGTCAVFLLPHAKRCRNVTIKNIHATDCAWALRTYLNPFTHSIPDDPDNLTTEEFVNRRGRFAGCVIQGVVELTQLAPAGSFRGEMEYSDRLFVDFEKRNGDDSIGQGRGWTDYPGGVRKNVDPIAPVGMLSAYSETELKFPWLDRSTSIHSAQQLGRYWVDLSDATIIDNGVNHSRGPILYRQDAVQADASGEQAVSWIID